MNAQQQRYSAGTALIKHGDTIAAELRTIADELAIMDADRECFDKYDGTDFAYVVDSLRAAARTCYERGAELTGQDVTAELAAIEPPAVEEDPRDRQDPFAA